MMHIAPLTKELLSLYSDSYLATLAHLSPVGQHTIDTLLDCLDRMHAQGTTVYSAVEEGLGIVGTCSILIEHKFNRG